MSLILSVSLSDLKSVQALLVYMQEYLLPFHERILSVAPRAALEAKRIATEIVWAYARRWRCDFTAWIWLHAALQRKVIQCKAPERQAESGVSCYTTLTLQIAGRRLHTHLRRIHAHYG